VSFPVCQTPDEARPKAKKLSNDRENLIPEVPVYGSIGTGMNRLVSGRADAVRYRNGGAEIVFDWKSDVRPEPAA
jgi:hypothetical protein